MFRLKRGNTSYKSQKFKNVDLQLELSPYPWMFMLAKTTVNTKICAIESSSVDFTASQGDEWSVGIGHRYESIESGKSNLLTYDVSYRINPKWKVRAYGRYDSIHSILEEQEYTVYRDLHCWIAELTYGLRENPRDQTIWFALRLKAFPEMPIGLRRAYSRPRPGRTAEP
jgi:hypothetical protein